MEKLDHPSDLKLADIVACNCDNPSLGDVQFLVQIQAHPRIQGHFIVLDLEAMEAWPSLTTQMQEVSQ